MKIYFEEAAHLKTGLNSAPAEIQEGLKQALLQRFPSSRLDTVFALAYDRDNQFFLKADNEILWGRVLPEGLKSEHLHQIALEWEQYRMTFRQRVRLCLFFPFYNESGKILPADWQDACFFQYNFYESQEGKACLLKEWLTGESKQLIDFPFAASEKKAPAGLLSRAQLSRDEILELMDLSLELRRSAPY